MVSKGKRAIIPQGVRFDVFRRDNFKCVYCGASSPEVTLECDHVVAVANGGSDDISNLVTACWDCNRGKGAKVVAPRAISGGKETTNMPTDPIIGMFGHSRDAETGKIVWQYQVKGLVGDRYAVQLFSWMDGRPTKMEFISADEIVNTEKHTLYLTQDEWTWSWALEAAREDGKGQRWAEGTFYLSTGRHYGAAA